ncbi:hypothetical protein ACWCQ0_39105, partial [Streptomyces massasporeus]
MTKPARETMWSEGDVGGERASGLFKAAFKALPRWWNGRWPNLIGPTLVCSFLDAPKLAVLDGWLGVDDFIGRDRELA